MAPRTRAQRKRAREEEDEKRCRLCLEGEADGPLVQLCACRGSAKLVHRRCLEKWRRTSPLPIPEIYLSIFQGFHQDET